MSLTIQQLELRRQSVGGSDVPNLFNGNAYAVWLSKIYKLEQGTTAAMDFGARAEPMLLDWAEEKLGGKIQRNVRIALDGTYLADNIDGILDDAEPVEAKTSGIVGPIADGWGEANTDLVPQYVHLQCQAHMIVTGAGVCHVPALLGGRDPCLVMYHVPRSEILCDAIKEAVDRFWIEHVVAQIPPSMDWDYGEAAKVLDVYKRVVRVPGKILEPGAVDPKLVKRWEAAKDFVKYAKDHRDRIKAEVVHQLDDAEAAELPDGSYLAYVQQQGRRSRCKMCNHVTEGAPFRVLRAQKSLPKQLEAR